MIQRITSLLLFLVIGLNAYAAVLSHLEVKENGQQSIIELSLKGAVTPRLFPLTLPHRLVVDLDNTQNGINLKRLGLRKQLITQVREGRPKPATLRLVFDLKQAAHFECKPWQLNRAGFKGFRIIVSSAYMARAQTRRPAVKTNFIRRSPETRSREVIVAIDAGHGGKDPGAIGAMGSKEKNLVLAIALKLKAKIDKEKGMRAVLTRRGDYYVGLRERLDLARKYNADIFVAIHADAFINKESKGSSVFALSQTGATSEAARWLAEKENTSELGGVDLSDFDDGVVRSVLIDLSQTATIGAGLNMGKAVLGQLARITSLHNTKVEQARFVVLKSPDIPSILVETGFITNPKEEAKLRSDWHQRAMSEAIFKGIKAYFWDHPPHGTYLEAVSERRTHLVQPGETMLQIATRYRISIAELALANPQCNLRRLRKGQKLMIPSKKWV